jgi:ABC-type transport system substrate-binding protein
VNGEQVRGRCRQERRLRLLPFGALLPPLLFLSACSDRPWNDPYPASEFYSNTLYSAFDERPKHLDPARSYSSNEYEILGQIYEPPLQYHYLERPYRLVRLTAEQVPEPVLYGAGGHRLDDQEEADAVAYSVYEIRIRPGIRYQPHPAFARDQSGAHRYFDLRDQDLSGIAAPGDFDHADSRELHAGDYIYQIKRLAHPRLHSPIFGLMSEYIEGLSQLRAELSAALEAEGAQGWLDLRDFNLSGVELVDRYTYRIRIKGKYPQFVFWLSMPFFAPLPWEVERFYDQPPLREKNLTLDWYPVGTGAYMLATNNPNKEMVLVRNPEFRGEPYPETGEPADRTEGLLADAGKTMPFIDRVVFSREKETIPYWNKFLQGYYDASGISSDSFDQAVNVMGGGEVELTDRMRERGIELETTVASSTFYFGFNMLDPVLGGYDERARKLRRAIAIAVDYEEYISIFLNGRGIPAQGPVPPGIFGYRHGPEGINPYVYDWIDGQPRRKPISEAQRLLREAGYPDGVDPETGKPLLLYFDTVGSGPDSKAQLAWWRKQFRKLNIALVIRNTDYNRFQDKMLKGTAQMFQWGWNADYPDPENFLFLLYGPNAKKGKNGENAANYANTEFDLLFERMKNMRNGPGRQAIIDRMLDILHQEGPWLWGLHPKRFSLHHGWYQNVKPTLFAHNTLMYRRVDPVERAARRMDWNRPVIWPFVVTGLVLVLFAIPAAVGYWRKEHAAPREEPAA